MKTTTVITGLLAPFSVQALVEAKRITLPLAARRVPRGIHENRQEVSFSKRHGARGAAVEVPLTDWINGTDLQWYSEISVGTPPQHFNVLFDTGSTDILLPRNNCTTCGTHQLFDPSKSSTFQDTTDTELNFTYVTGADQFPLPSAEGGSGAVVTDIVELFGLTSPEQGWVLGDVYADIFAKMAPDGVLGLGPVNYSSVGAMPFYWNLYYSGQLESPKFSWFISPGHELGGELTLGGVDETKHQGPITTISLNETISALAGAWTVDQHYVYIGGKAVLNSSSDRPFEQGISALDTGTAFIQPPDTQTTQDLYAAISPEIQPVGDLGSWGAPCDVLDKIAVDVTFQFGPVGEFNATLPKEFFNLGPFPGQTELCEAIFVAPPGGLFDPLGGIPVWVIGSPLLKHYFTVWDGLNYEVGFAMPTGL